MSSARFLFVRRLMSCSIDKWWQVIPVRYGRGKGMEVNIFRFKNKFQKQITKYGLHKHGIEFMVPTVGANKPEPVVVQIKKKKPRTMVDNQRGITLAATIFPYVCEIVHSGELGEEFDSLNITLTRLEVANNFSALKVYWYRENDPSDVDAETEAKLRNLSSLVREHLATTSVLPSIPQVVFVLDKDEQERIRLEKALASISSELNPEMVRQKENVPDVPTEEKQSEKNPDWMKKIKKKAKDTKDNAVK